ncbi:16S rRNA (cytosine(1402)-N(4))-methyltransferase RsmH [Roseiconus nitratireducens]|uniref:Ribosomal RNA small subunit methyltransferase H n=1 Tax=Roseiconus nitratireducens TaxID=2605748 RepID=A0A5M6DCI5_9BACT|nr:16S rRNA (cytosine(1402)-N(4))-methyltransferase RsmH [Roseiconus nitratireducens]KAA5545271.1 16S rRNA (cytosine(1402)-N(4))-methyltransferase RsmH [Roseiconus nitratireducens]
MSPSTDPPSEESTCHVSVLPDEIVQWVADCQPRVVIDGTFGGGGHARRLLDVVPADGLVIGLDRDPAVLARVESQPPTERLTVFLGSYEQAGEAMKRCDVKAADAMVLDLGLSSDQLADRNRGFSFQNDGPLDLRFDPESGVPASEWLSRRSEKEIADAIYQYGEERASRRIAREIVGRQRERRPVQTVNDLVEICRRCVRRGKHHDIHPATRTFQALRIAVNEELEILKRTLQIAPQWLSPGGRLAVISFHSLEDRLVKTAFRDDPRWNVLTRKPIRPGDAETQANPRARSAKLRVAERATS